MASDNFFTTYAMVEPPSMYKDFELEQGESFPITALEEDSKDSGPFLHNDFKIGEYPGVSSPFDKDWDITYDFEEAPSLNKTKVIKQSPIQQNRFSNLVSIDIEDLFKREGITSINGKKIKFGSKALRTSSIGTKRSHHRERDPHTGNANARDISIVGGTVKDYADLKNILLSNPTIRKYMQIKGWGVINEITPEILRQTGGTGMHFHFGPDIWARKTWDAWTSSSDIDVTKNFRS